MIKTRIVKPPRECWADMEPEIEAMLVGREIWIGKPVAKGELAVTPPCDSDTFWFVTGPEELIADVNKLAASKGWPVMQKWAICRHMLDIGD